MVAIISRIAKYIPKAVGIAGLGLVCYDSHKVGQMQSDFYATERDVSASMYYLNNDMYSTSLSSVTDAVKDKAYKIELDQGWRRFFNSGIGYGKGFISMLISNIIPTTLSLGAVLTKGATSKFAAGGLVAYGLLKGVKNFFGLDVPPDHFN